MHLAIGDIHGCSTALRTLLATLGPGPDDVVVTLGDYVDIGPDAPGVLDQLIEMQALTRIVPLRGNHDQLMLDARDGRFELARWTAVGGGATLEAYGGDLRQVPDAHWAFLERSLDWHATDTHIFVHGGVDPDLPPEDQSRQLLHWLPVDACLPHCSGRTIVCGHSRQVAGVPLHLGHAICIDTDVAAESGWLTALNLADGACVQASQEGAVRKLTHNELRRAG